MQNGSRHVQASAPRNGRSNGGSREPLVRRMVFKDKNGNVTEEKDLVTYAGLLSKAHDEGLKRIMTKVVQLPTEENRFTAVIAAEVETGAGVFAGIGDANPQNVKPKIVPHLIRMAETRAKARALRDAVNVGVLALEELTGADDNGNGGYEHQNGHPPVERHGQQQAAPSNAPPAERPTPPPRTTVAPRQSPPEQRPTPAGSSESNSSSADPMTEKQRRYLFRLLSARGVEGEAANEQIRRALGVRDLRQASKAAASELIDTLVADAVTQELGGGRAS